MAAFVYIFAHIKVSGREDAVSITTVDLRDHCHCVGHVNFAV